MTTSVSIFKSLTQNEYTITPFKLTAPFTYVYTSGSTSNSVDTQILRGEKSSDSGLRVENSAAEIYDSVIQTFYSVLPYSYYGIKSYQYNPSASNELYVISITQDIFGQKILPGSVSVLINNTSSIDDGLGNLIVSASNTASYIGGIFYDKGIVTVKSARNELPSGGINLNGMSIISGSTVTVNFSSSVDMYEHNIKIKIAPTEFNFSLHNPTINKSFYTGSDATPLDFMTSRSRDPGNDLYLAPYVTTIGLYNPNNELLAVAKISSPIQRSFDSTQTFIIKFDA
jgi:hypothetical protein